MTLPRLAAIFFGFLGDRSRGKDGLPRTTVLEVHRNVIDVESIAFLMTLLAPEVSFVTLHMRWHKKHPKASTKKRPLRANPEKLRNMTHMHSTRIEKKN